MPNQWLIIEETSTFIPGDERSRTNPGHGYPERIEHGHRVEFFTDRVEWEARVRTLHARGAKFTCGTFAQADIVTSVEVSIND